MPQLKKIAVIHDSVEARGGATGLARLSALEYRKRGYAVSYLTGEGSEDEELIGAGIEIVGLGQAKLAASGALKAMSSGFHNASAQSMIANWIAEHDTPETVYHLHNWAQILSPSVFNALEPVAERTVVSCHDFFNVCPNGGLLNFRTGQACQLKPMSAACWASQCDRRSPAHKYWRMARHLRLSSLADFKHSTMTFVCLNAGMERVMRDAGFPAPRLTNIPNPATAFSDQRIQAESNRTFLFAGRLNREKGADLAASAASDAGVELVMAGEGDLAAALAQQYPQIEFAGFCTRDRLASLVRNARALIVPGRWREPFGLVMAEAALSGVPVLVSEPSTLASDIDRLGIGRSFDPASETALTSLLTTLAKDDELVRTFSQNAFAHAPKICSTTDAWVDGFISLFEQSLSC